MMIAAMALAVPSERALAQSAGGSAVAWGTNY